MKKIYHFAIGGSASGGKHSAFCILHSAFPCAFTLIELLVVISIIAILAGMVMPMFYSAKERAREAKARIEVKALETAFKSYLDTYKVWPAAILEVTPYEVEDDGANKIFSMLSGNSAAGVFNSQNIAFYEFNSTNSTETKAYDPWGANPGASLREDRVYRVMFDKDYDNKISVGGQDVYRCVVVWSVGKNGVNDNGECNENAIPPKDDVASWK